LRLSTRILADVPTCSPTRVTPSASAEFDAENEGAALIRAGDRTRFALFVTPNTQRAGHTQLGFEVDDIEAEVADLKSRGVVFEEYDLPGFKTVGSIAETPPTRAAWFLDPDHNTVGPVQLS
jgi:catechol 2,3-dioxygenase-like lactoylglutathione lyase family enzyme